MEASLRSSICVLSVAMISASSDACLTADWADCWSDFISQASQCCNIGTPEAVNACLVGETEAYGICLQAATDQLPDWHAQFRAYIKQCDTGPICGFHNSPGKEACFAAARQFLRWCKGHAVTYVDLPTTPVWTVEPEDFELGDDVTLTSVTDSALIVQVRYIAYRPDASSTDPDAIFVIGNGAPTSLGGNQKSWSITSDSDNWPLGSTESRILIWAESYEDVGGNRVVRDASDAISVTISH